MRAHFCARRGRAVGAINKECERRAIATPGGGENASAGSANGKPAERRRACVGASRKKRGATAPTALPVGRDGAPERGRRSATSAAARSDGQPTDGEERDNEETWVSPRTTEQQRH